MLNRIAMSRNVFTEYYMRTIDQFGLSTTLGLFGDTYLEGNLGYLKSRANADRLGGTARFVFPLSDRFAFTLEGGMNETLVSRDNTGRVVAGFQFGNFMRPKDYVEGYNGIRHAVPMDVPRVRYEIMTRTARTGNDAPVADDQEASTDEDTPLSGTLGATDVDGDSLTYTVDASVGGKIAQLGSRIIDGFARKMADEFFTRFQEAVEGPAEPEVAEAAEGEGEGEGEGEKKKGWFKRLIG